MLIQTHDGKRFDVPEENLESFLKDYNKAIGFDPNTLSADPEINPERGVNFGGGVRAAAQGLPVVGSYADEAEATVRAAGDALVQEMMYQQEHRNDPKPEPKLPGLTGKLMQGMEDYNAKQDRYNEFFDQSYDKYLKNARESYEGAKRNMPGVAYPLEIGTGIVGEAGLAALTGGASLHPAVQGAMGAVYGYGMGEGDAINRGISSLAVGGASAALPLAGKYTVKYAKPVVNKGLEYVGKKIANKEMPALMKALAKPNSVKETVASTNLTKATDAIIDNISKVDVLPEEKPVVQNIINALSGNTQKNGHLLLKDADAALDAARKQGVLSEDTTVNLFGALHDTPKTIEGKDAFTINNLRTTINKGKSIAEKEAIADDLLKNTTKVKALYDTMGKDIDEVLALGWKDQLDDTLIDLNSKFSDNLSDSTLKRLSNRLYVSTASGAEQTVKDSSDDLITKNIIKEVKSIIASEKDLSKEFAQELEDRIVSEVLSRRTATSLAGKSLQSSEKGLTGSLLTDTALGIATDAIIPGAGIGGALIRNILPGNSSLSRIKGALTQKATNKAISTRLAGEQNTAAGLGNLATIVTANRGGLLNRWGEKEIEAAMKHGSEISATKETAGQKIVNALKPYKAVVEGIKKASKKPTKQLVKEAIKVAPKTAIPVGIREGVKGVNEIEPFNGKQEREKRLNDMLLNNLKRVPNNTTIILPDNVDSGPSITEKHLRLLAALYPQYYQKVA